MIDSQTTHNQETRQTVKICPTAEDLGWKPTNGGRFVCPAPQCGLVSSTHGGLVQHIDSSHPKLSKTGGKVRTRSCFLWWFCVLCFFVCFFYINIWRLVEPMSCRKFWKLGDGVEGLEIRWLLPSSLESEVRTVLAASAFYQKGVCSTGWTEGRCLSMSRL